MKETYNLTSLESFDTEVEAGALFLPLTLLFGGGGALCWLSELGLLGGESFIWFWDIAANAPGCCCGGGEACCERLLRRVVLEVLLN